MLGYGYIQAVDTPNTANSLNYNTIIWLWELGALLWQVQLSLPVVPPPSKRRGL